MNKIQQYIVDIDSMTTSEFCEAHNLPKPVNTGDVKTSATSFLQIDAIKFRLVKEFNRENIRDKGNVPVLPLRHPLVIHEDTGWACKDSPLNTCVYNTKLDSMHDSCIYCGEPYERK